ncbi:iron complex transport system permease protein [Pullulanibacillus pueri]|uniref:Iron ABC transporter permease n=1 Tax=Pullulanibacillus pueri TaxID=1437324 RepID=A0A8J2ZTM1_9BACL|nr:iron ABC transporter permease [Pullulanibacillus pueri]MBM7681873.1 iron complex transport system permease protein [Pullulanibacillus pueri]GGH76424.1 iron ABC transporter permease [Pullulanibacillus pueri]
MKNQKYWSLRARNASFLIDKRAFGITLILFILFLVMIVLSLGLGDLFISPLSVVKAIFGQSTEMNNLVVQSFRFPRILVAGLAGMGLAVAGAILQGLVRNPLASPDIIGVTTGASLTTVIFLTFFSAGSETSMNISIQWLPIFSFIGALAMGLLVYFLSKRGVSATRLVLIGIGLSAGAKAFTDLMLVLGPSYLASQASIWMTGSVNGASWTSVLILFIWIFVFLVLSLSLSRRLNAQTFGEKIAVGIGNNLRRDRVLLLIISTALAGGSVAYAGTISFIGLMAPHMARRLVGSSYGSLIPVSGLLGGLVVMLSDLIGRTVFLPLEVPAGVFTAAIGAPYFIYLLYKTRKWG